MCDVNDDNDDDAGDGDDEDDCDYGGFVSPSAHQESLSASFALSQGPQPSPCNFWRKNPI